MADFPNFVDMVFGRIDRNTDTQYRDRALQQNQNQFTSQLDVDKDRVALEKDRVALEKERTRLANEQFLKNFGLQSDQFTQQKSQQGFTNNVAINEAVAKGVFKPIATPQQQGVMPGNMFMQNPAAIPSVDNGDPTMGPGFEFNGGRYQPVNQKQVERKFADEDEQYKIQQFTRHLKVDPFTARLMVTNPQMIAHVVGSNNIVGLLSLAGKGVIPTDVIDSVIKNMGSQTATQAEAGVTDSERALRSAQTGNFASMSGLHSAQAKALTMSKAGEGVYNQAVSAVQAMGIDASDPKFIGSVRSYINSLPIDENLKNEAASVATRDTAPRTLGNNWLNEVMKQNQNGQNRSAIIPQATPTIIDRTTAPRGSNQLTPTNQITQQDLTRPDNWNERAVQPIINIPAPNMNDISRPSGSGPAQVNSKPPTVGGPLSYIQPNSAPLMQFIPQHINEVGASSLAPSSPSELLQYHPLAYPVNKFSDMMNKWKQRQNERRYN